MPGACITESCRFLVLFDHSHVGCGVAVPSWRLEYGCATDSVADFNALYSYSPVHNVRLPLQGQQFPAVFINTGEKDITRREIPLSGLLP
jgi:hypothetical protein